MKARRMDKPSMQTPPCDQSGRPVKPSRRKSVRPQSPNATKQKRRNGERIITDPDEMMPVAPNRFVMGSDGAAAIKELDRKCNDLAETFMQRIRDFNYVPHEQMSLEEKREERRRYLEVHRRLRA